MLDLYVSIDGKDEWTGLLPAPSADGQDGPFATLERARNEIRHRGPETTDGGMTVHIRGGCYEMEQPLSLGKEDGGAQDNPILYRAYDQETATLNGGRAISNFQPVDDPDILSRLLEQARGHVVQANLSDAGFNDLGEVDEAQKRIELFFNDEPMTLARWPNEGFVTVVDVNGGDPFTVHGIDGDRIGRFVYEGDRPARWEDEADIRLHGYWFWDWSDAFQRVASIDTDQNTITLEAPYHNYGYRPGQRYYALNLLCELDQPGEWYIDRNRSMLYFWPPGEITGTNTVLSVLSSLITTEDASWITIQGLTLESTRGTAITVSGGEGVRITGCEIRNTGSWGIGIDGGQKHSVIGCDLYQTGEGGIILSGGDRISLTAAGHEAINNHIHQFGRLYRTYRPAVSIQGVGNRVAHNLIHDGPHNAIQLHGNDHVIEYNDVYDVCYETGDVGAFYMGRDWTERGVIIRYNYFHDIKGPGLHGAMAVYLDDAAGGVTIFGNIFCRSSRSAFIGGGRDNTVENNIFMDCEPSVHVDARGMGWMRYHVEKDGIMPERLAAMPYETPPWSDRYPELLTLLDSDPGEPAGNRIVRNISMGGRWTDIDEAAQPLVSFEDNLVDENPGFADEQTFELRDDAPAISMGFEQIPFGKIGLYDTDHRLKDMTSPIDDSWYEHHPVPDRISCGGVVCRIERGQVMVAMAKEADFPFFVLPKGGLEPGESHEEAAKREIHEEAGLYDLTLIRKLGMTERLAYSKRVWVKVHMFLFVTTQIEGTPTDEHRHYGVWWYSIDAIPPMFWPEQERFLVAHREEIKREVLGG